MKKVAPDELDQESRELLGLETGKRGAKQLQQDQSAVGFFLIVSRNLPSVKSIFSLPLPWQQDTTLV
jgi:hypothetical protein